MYLASIARQEGYEPRIKDYSLNNETLNDVIKDIEEFKPQYLLLNAATPTLKNDLGILTKIKGKFPEIITIAKGAHFNILAKEALETYTGLDIAIRGESELTFGEILSGKPLDEILGNTGFRMLQKAMKILLKYYRLKIARSIMNLINYLILHVI